MRQRRMDAAIAAQSHQVQAMRARVSHQIEQHGDAKEFARGDHDVDARYIHVNDAPGADIQMPDLAVAHLSLG